MLLLKRHSVPIGEDIERGVCIFRSHLCIETQFTDTQDTVI